MSRSVSSMLRASFAAAAFSLFVLPSAVEAQVASQVVRVDVPFAFESGSQHLPAGSYVVSVDSRRFVTVEGMGQKASVIGYADEPVNSGLATAVLFRQYGERRFLRGVRVAGRTSTRTPITREEKQVQVAADQARTSGVMVAMAEGVR